MMKTRLALTLGLLFSFSPMLPAVEPSPSKKTSSVMSNNPFFIASTLAYQLPPFDKIKDEHYLPAFEKGMSENRAEIEAIANNKEPPSLENTLVAMERSGRLLQRVSTVFFNLVGANTNDKLEKIEAEIAPKLSAHKDATFLNKQLFERISSLYQRREQLGLDAESKRLVERYYSDFVRAGAKLSEADKTKLKALNAELATLKTRFSQNLLKETNASAVVVDKREDLKGLSPEAIAAAAEGAKERKLEGKYVISLQNTTGQAALSSLENRTLRERIMKASLERGSHGGEFDNRSVVAQMAKLRAERSALLGYSNHATYEIEDETAHTVDTVNKLLAQLAAPAIANARHEAADMQAIIDQEKDTPHFELAAWDWDYYAEKVRQSKYQYDETQLRPYFELESVLQNGVFYAAHQLYGLNFKERKDLPIYQSDVRVFEVSDADGKPLALFLMDYYARSNKRGGAWMNSYVDQNTLFATKPVIANHLNIPKPRKGEPTLLTFDEVTTAFHEFGHALHGMFSNVHYPYFSGTNVPRDFVEYPSQVNEMWAVWPDVLKNYAKHYKTGEPIPQVLLDKVLATRKFNQGFMTTEYLGAALLDQAYHQITPEQAPTADGVLAFETAALKKFNLDYAPVPPRYRSTYFSHAFAGGYSAGYYAYIWSEVLDADSVEWFKQNGGLKRENGDHFRNTLLSHGGSEDAMNLFRAFRGRDPDVKPLLERRGLTLAQ